MNEPKSIKETSHPFSENLCFRKAVNWGLHIFFLNYFSFIIIWLTLSEKQICLFFSQLFLQRPLNMALFIRKNNIERGS